MLVASWWFVQGLQHLHSDLWSNESNCRPHVLLVRQRIHAHVHVWPSAGRGFAPDFQAVLPPRAIRYDDSAPCSGPNSLYLCMGL